MISLSAHEIEEYKEKCLLGYWKMEKENGITVRMYVDKNMQKLIGVPDGYSPEACCQFFMAHINPEEMPKIISYEREMMRGSAEVVYRYNHPTKGEMKVRCAGRRIHTYGNIDVMVGDHKELSGTVQIEDENRSAEIFQRRGRDIQIKESQDFYFSLMDKMPYGVLVATADTQQILYMNREALRIYGARDVKQVQEVAKTRSFIQASPYSLKQLQRLAQEDITLDFECRVLGVNERLMDAICYSEAITALDGIRCIFTTLIDVSENKALKSRYDIVNSLSKMFDSIYYVNMLDGSFVEIGKSSDNNVVTVIGEGGNAKDAFARMCKYLIVPKCIEKVREFTNLDTLNERLKEKAWISCEYVKSNFTWREGIFIAADRDDNGDCQHVIWGIRDINAQKQRELRYRVDLEKAYEIVAAAGMGLWEMFFFEGEKPRMKANRKMLEMLHLSEEELDEYEIYKAWHSRIKPEALASVNASVAAMLDGIQNENTYLWEDPVLGDQYVRCGGYCEKIDGKGYILRGYHYNVNDEVLRMQKEHIARQKLVDLKLQTVSEAIHGGFKISKNDPYFTFNMVSVQLANLLGYDTPEELMVASGGRMSNLVNHEDAAKAMPKAVEAVANGKMYTMHYRLRCKDGHWMNVEDRGRLITNENGESEYWSFIVNQDQLTELENANKAKAEFLFNMSHDIRTPMNAIIGYSQLMKRELKDPKLLDYQHKIDISANLLLSIINHVLDMASIDSGKLNIREDYGYIPDIAATIVNVFQEEAKKKDITLDCRINCEHCHILCDMTKLNELYANLLSNSIKYTPEGGKVSALIEELPSEKEGQLLYRTTISDTGIGMSADFLPHVFDSFSRERNSTVSGIQGTGLGMAIVKKLVDLLEGTIEVESKVGQGTKFVVTLPHKIAAEALARQNSNASNGQSQVDLTGKHILLAEDNELNAEIAVALLEQTGVNVDRARDGLECLKMLEDKPAGAYDMILMDIQMPKMNGYEATRAIRKLSDKAKSSIPIIAITANAFEEDKRNALAAGMNGHIAKPINVKQLEAVVLQCVSSC